jgi:tetratricopeptide (TPR) repeat protein
LCLLQSAAPRRGLTAAPQVAAAYDAVLNADFDRMPEVLAATCGPAPAVACLGLGALATWWDIQLDPQSRALDARFSQQVEAAIDAARAWADREPERAEAWFYLGAALGARSQWKVLREERLSAARDGKRIKEALERALTLDPALHDAEFGIGVYRYYAGVAPAYFRWLRWLLLLPGGNRAEGLAQMQRASREAIVVRAEADYQLHVAYLWYERRFAEALAIVVDLQSRYPRNALFRHLEAEIRSVYFSDAAGSLAASETLLDLARTRRVHRAGLAEVRALLNIAVQSDRLGQRARARAALDALLALSPRAPVDAVARARELARRWSSR